MIKTLGVIGAGQMGNGIAHVGALAGMDVRIIDVSADAVKRAIETIDQNMQRQVRRGMIQDDERKAALKRIKSGADYALLKDCDIVIEAAVEKEQVKRDILKQLVPVLKPDAIQIVVESLDLGSRNGGCVGQYIHGLIVIEYSSAPCSHFCSLIR